MSLAYDRYLDKHKNNVRKAANWIFKNIPENIISDKIRKEASQICMFDHDNSKFDSEEYNAYDKYFYGNRSNEVVNNFYYAWNRHLHKNKHHWQHWVLINDDKDSGEKLLEIPEIYIVEMICDWWSFSWEKGNLYEIFDWYEEGKDYRKINPKSKQKIEMILSEIKKVLDSKEGK